MHNQLTNISITTKNTDREMTIWSFPHHPCNPAVPYYASCVFPRVKKNSAIAAIRV